MSDDETYVELYGELISLKELAISSLISTVLAFALYYISPYAAQVLGMPNLASALKITLGAIGASIGFFLSVPITRVKRVIEED
ncbi:MAG: hypothetical protein QW039_03975 [Fervidicoccaceae archaeon]